MSGYTPKSNARNRSPGTNCTEIVVSCIRLRGGIVACGVWCCWGREREDLKEKRGRGELGLGGREERLHTAESNHCTRSFRMAGTHPKVVRILLLGAWLAQVGRRWSMAGTNCAEIAHG
eukprot:3219822-Rhodomonas_salina.1